MAGDWLKMSVNLPDKPEVWQIAGMLGIEADSVVGKLLRVWAWFDAHTEDGNAVGVTYPLVDRVAGVTGFAEAMVLAGWLHQNGSVMTVPHFERHNGKTAKNRALTNERVAKHRKSNDQSNGGSNAGTVTKTVTREEKRREDIDTGGADLFERFYDAYPRKVGRDAARKAFAKRQVTEALLVTMLAAIKRQGLKDRCAKGESQYVPHPATWLNEGRWQDEDGQVDDDPFGLRRAL
jgi:hypothetical protein